MITFGEGLEFHVLFGDRDEKKVRKMLKVAEQEGALWYERGAGFWHFKAEHAVHAEYPSLDKALNAARKIRAAGEQEAVLVVIWCEEGYHAFAYKLLVTKDGFTDAEKTDINYGLSEDGCGFCPEGLRRKDDCWYV